MVLPPMRGVKVNGLVRSSLAIVYTKLMLEAFLPTNAALYYDITTNPAVALFFGWVCYAFIQAKHDADRGLGLFPAWLCICGNGYVGYEFHIHALTNPS